MILNLINTFKNNPRKLFLIDGFGAVISAVSLGVILVKLETFFGMPPKQLYILSGAAFIFAMYSFFCYFRFPMNWRPFLKVIAISNLIYCSVTIGLVVYLFQTLTTLGLIYFILELVIIIFLVRIELKVAFV